MNITDINIDEIQKFIKNVVNHLYVKILIYGEISTAQARRIAQFLRNDVRTGIPVREVLPHREIKLENSK